MPDRYGDPDPERDTDAADYARRAVRARSIRCRYCGADADHHCVNAITGDPLYKFAVHPIRITDADTVVPLPAEPDEELF